MPPIESTPVILALWAVIGYLLGSIPFGMVLAKVMNLGDLRQIGSGNIGATNVLRTGNKVAAVLTLLLDATKGAVAVLLARFAVGEDAAQVAGLMAMLGHCYPVWLKFKGGKGVATFIGVMLALSWQVGLVCCAVWLLAAALSRTSSIGAIAAASASTFAMVFTGSGEMMILGILLTLLIFWRHRENIRRIREGSEPKIGQKAG